MAAERVNPPRLSAWCHEWYMAGDVMQCGDCGVRADADSHAVCSGSPEYARIFALGKESADARYSACERAILAIKAAIAETWE